MNTGKLPNEEPYNSMFAFWAEDEVEVTMKKDSLQRLPCLVGALFFAWSIAMRFSSDNTLTFTYVKHGFHQLTQLVDKFVNEPYGPAEMEATLIHAFFPGSNPRSYDGLYHDTQRASK